MRSFLLIAQVFGLLGVIFYLLSFQFKKRSGILLVNTISRVFYVLQYLFLGAFDGMAMDLLGLISALLASLTKPLSRMQKAVIFLTINLAILATGFVLYRNLFSLLAIAAILLETTALWLQNERYLRILSLLSAPLWLIYNLSALAFGSALGNALAILSLSIAMVRFDRSRS